MCLCAAPLWSHWLLKITNYCWWCYVALDWHLACFWCSTDGTMWLVKRTILVHAFGSYMTLERWGSPFVYPLPCCLLLACLGWVIIVVFEHTILYQRDGLYQLCNVSVALDLQTWAENALGGWGQVCFLWPMVPCRCTLACLQLPGSFWAVMLLCTLMFTISWDNKKLAQCVVSLIYCLSACPLTSRRVRFWLPRFSSCCTLLFACQHGLSAVCLVVVCL